MKATAREAGARWRALTKAQRDDALLLIQIERRMWRYGKGTNWAPSALPTVKTRYRVLGIAIALLRASAKRAGR